MAAEKYAEAEIDYLRATQAKPDLGDAWYGLGMAQFKQGHLSDALKSLTRASDLLPSREDIAVSLAETSMAIYLASPARTAELYQRVVATSANLLKRNPNSFDGVRLKGYVAFIDRHYPEAIELLRKADSVKPGQGDVTQALMESLIQTGQGLEAEKIGTAFLVRQKNYIPVYDVLYGYYMTQHRDGDAEQLLKNKIAANPGVLLFRLQLARHYLDAQKVEEMSAVLKQVQDDSKDFPDGRLAIGDFYRANNRLDDALRAFQAGAAQGGKQKTTFQQRSADVLVAMGKSAEAIPVLQEILTTNPENIAARSLRATIRLESGTPEDAQAAFTDLRQLAVETAEGCADSLQFGQSLAGERQYGGRTRRVPGRPQAESAATGGACPRGRRFPAPGQLQGCQPLQRGHCDSDRRPSGSQAPSDVRPDRDGRPRRGSRRSETS